ncbi:hypothetical protein [Candidatus Mycoplasma haematohominis]|uniref:Uncharacterized protein n=1 Tax=Candidatus Mycoplasma haematohominis TaxID=1494318 RepID=A0A478FR34_9MOLU|nr:hypothetical protein [Candidatus Mycoplasma haemohominis]GCE63607.1 hypothetical protein MHSWG343_06040 [Candidatus Mycoplasma haemohominis]
MLTESKITIAIATGGGNATLGVSINEFLKVYLLKKEEFEEIVALDNSSIGTTIPSRKKISTVSFNPESKRSFDPRSRQDKPSTIDYSGYKSHVISQVKHIAQHRNKVVVWNQNQNWWDSVYEQRMYMIKNQDFSSKEVQFQKGYSTVTVWYLNKPVYMNQFCELLTWNSYQFKDYEDLFWLVCTTDGKNPNEKNPDSRISFAEKAKFPTEKPQEKEIIYMTLAQAKKKTSDIENIKVKEKDKYVVYDWKPEWWEWSYQYRWKKDKSEENSAFPLSKKFTEIEKGWDENLNNAKSLNTACKEFYEANNPTKEEIEDSWRYCSVLGKETN